MWVLMYILKQNTNNYNNTNTQNTECIYVLFVNVTQEEHPFGHARVVLWLQ